TYEYDNYASDARHAPLVARPGITGHDPAYTASFTVRGNETGETSYANAAAQSGGVTTSTQYDVAGNEVKTIDGDGGVSQEGYADSFSDGVNRNTYAFPTSTTSPVPDPTGVYGSTTALTTSTVYDFSTGLARSTTDANAKTTSFEYNDALDRPTRANRPDGGWTSFFYDDAHACGPYIRADTLLDAAGRVTSDFQFFDRLGRVARTFKSDPQDAARPYLTVDTQYDALGRPWRVSNQYRSAGCTSAVNPSARWTETTFDALGRPTLVKSTADDAAVTTTYSGNQVTITDQAGKQRRSVTDALGRLTRVVEDPAGLAYATDYVYDALGSLRKVTQGTQLRFFMYDSLGRLTRARNPEQAVNAAITGTDPVTGNAQWSFAYAYDANGNLTTRTDPRNVTTTYTYDPLDRNTYVSYSDSTPHVKRAYDTATNGRGLLRAGWTLTAAGTHLTQSAVDSYDAMGRPLVRRQHFYTNNVAGPAFSTRRTYDRAGHVLTQTYPSGRTVTYTYDSAGRLATFAGNLGDGVQRTYASEVRYHELGGVEQERFGTQTPVYSKRFYNVRGQLAEVRVSTQSILAADPGHWNRGAILNVYSGLAGWTESREDNNGNLRKQMVYVPNDDAISGWWETAFFYDYDALNRLLQSREVRGGQNQWVQAFTYDRWGNRAINAANTTNAPEPQFTASAATNRLSPPAGYTMAYDTAGNLTTDTYTGSGTRTYDAENRMTSAQFVSGQAQTAAYTYDADGKRVKRHLGAGGEVWQVYGLDGELLAEYAAGAQPAAPLKEYGHRSGEPLVAAEPGAVVRWLVTDHLGTPRMVVDRTGSLAGVSRHDYFAFGEEVTAGRAGAQGYGQPDGLRQKWVGKERDTETGLNYFLARYHSSAQGRFTSPDEFQGGPDEVSVLGSGHEENQALPYADITEPQSLNKYQYCLNNPLRYVDPDGHKAQEAEDKTRRGVQGAAIHLGRTGRHEGRLRKEYQRRAAALHGKPNASAAREKLKKEIRQRSTPLGKGLAQAAAKSRAGQLAGKTPAQLGQSAPRTNAGWNKTGAAMGAAGRTLLVAGVGVSAYNIATAPEGQKGEAVAGEAGAWAGALAGGAGGAKVGAAIGTFITPGAGTAIGAGVGGIVGGVGGAIAGSSTGKAIYNWLTKDD
ncbi:MAG: hypothetical protein M3416_00215, partial [Acidobacteriota bacterium]|nr:hypothetical protein [Acidobacteriota bacterium]